MNKFLISYDERDHSALLSIDSSARAWDHIKRILNTKSPLTDLIDKHTIRVPWTIFLASYKDIEFHLKFYDIKIIFDNPSQELLLQSQKRKNSYLNATSSRLIDEQELLTRIEKSGFTGRNLLSYQIKNLRKICAHSGVANFSVPGAGKTIESIAYTAYHFNEIEKIFIVCPKNVFAVWEYEFKQCMPDRKFKFSRLKSGIDVKLLLEEEKDEEEKDIYIDIYICSFTKFKNEISHIRKFIGRYKTIVIVDESHKIKTSSSLSTQALLSISSLAKKRVIMSGTPCPQDFSDLVSQFSFLYPEIEDVNKDNVVSKFKPIYVRTKKDELDIPDPIYTIIDHLPLLKTQRKFYELITSSFERETQKISIGNKIALKKIGRNALTLIRLVSNPSLIVNYNLGHEKTLGDVLSEGDSPKLYYACLKARELSTYGKKVVIWSSFNVNIELLATRLSDLGALFIHGKVNTSQNEDDPEEESREWKINQFCTNDSCKVLIANPAACGEGISLHKVCQYAIYLDRNYNLAQYLQSVDRIHRIGLKSRPKIDILICPDTVDESVNFRLGKKQAKMALALNDQSLNVDPVIFNPENEELDDEDVKNFIEHIQSIYGSSND